MQERAPGPIDVALVIGSESLSDRLAHLLREWRLGARRFGEAEALVAARDGSARVVVCDWKKGRRLYLEQVKAAGAIPVVLLTERTETLSDVEVATAPSELVAAVFRAQGRLASAQTGNLERINRFSQAIAVQFSLPELVRVAIAKTQELCEADAASLALVDPDSGVLHLDAVTTEGTGGIERLGFRVGQGLLGKVAAEARPKLVAHRADAPDFDDALDRLVGGRVGSVVAVPLVLGGDVLGVLLALRGEDQEPFGPANLDRLVSLAPHVAIAVHNAQVTAALRDSQAQVMQVNASLEQKVRERTDQITRAKKEWERTFDVITEPIVLLDGFTIRRANHAYAQRANHRIQDLPGKSCFRVFGGREAPCTGCPLLKGRGASLHAELDLPHMAENRISTLSFSGYWMTDDPASEAVVIHYRDVTQARSLEERLRESERLAAVGQLASGAAHEINNPIGFVTSNLRSLRGLVDEVRQPLRMLTDAIEMAREGRTADLVALLRRIEDLDSVTLDDGLEMIDESLDGTRRVGEIVKGLRELSRLEIGKREAACVNSSVTRVLRGEFGDRPKVPLVSELKATAFAEIPPLQLDQAIGHVVKNARQAVSEGQGIQVRTWSTETEVVVEVRDEGMGIPRENLRRVFEPFFTTRGIGKGIGLGLTAAYGIIKRAGGDIVAASEGPGKGATFTIRLPHAETKSVAKVA